MSAPVLLGLDPGTRRMGYCVGTGEGLPTAGAWRFDQCGDDLGEMMHLIDHELVRLIDRERPDFLAYEAPIKTQWDKLLPLRKTLSLGVHIEFICRRFHPRIPCFEVDLHDVKLALAGSRSAQKDAMVRSAEKLGVALPAIEADGREDAADALGVWLELLRHHNKAASARYDTRLWSARGALL